MATDLERLVVQFSADFKRLENATKKQNALFSRQMRQMEKRADTSVRRINKAFEGVGRMGGVAKGLLTGVSIIAVKSYIDSALRIENALKVAGLSGKELTDVYNELFISAQRNAAPLESLVTLYGRAALVQKELGVSTAELLGFTDNVAVALRVAGADAQSASGALLQLSQALGSGVVRAEEFNSILEGAQPIAQAAAAGLKEAGGSVAKLRQLVVDGKVSSEAFFRAFEAGAPILKEKVANATLTIDQRFTNLKTSLIDAAKRFNNSTEASNTFGAAIDNVATYVNSINFDLLVSEINKILTAFNNAERASRNFAIRVAEATGLDNVGKFLTGGAAQKSYFGGGLTIKSTKAINERVAGAFDGIVEQADQELSDALKKKFAGKADKPLPQSKDTVDAPKFTPVSLADFAAPNSDKDNKKGKGSKGTPADRFDSDMQRIADRTAALVAETEAVRQINPLINDYGYAIEKARAEQELLNAAQKAGVAITPELREEISQTAEQFALATVEAAQLAEAQDKIRQNAEEMIDFQRDLTQGMVDGFVNGASAAEMFANALGKVADKLIEIGMNSIFDTDKGGFNIFGALGGMFGGGGDAWSGLRLAGGGQVRGPGGPTGDKIPAMLSDGEHVTRAAMVKKYGPLLNAINNDQLSHLAAGGFASGMPALTAPRMPIIRPSMQSQQQGAGVHVTLGWSKDADGNIAPIIESVSQQTFKQGIKQYDKGSAVRTSADLRQVNQRGYGR